MKSIHDDDACLMLNQINYYNRVQKCSSVVELCKDGRLIILWRKNLQKERVCVRELAVYEFFA